MSAIFVGQSVKLDLNELVLFSSSQFCLVLLDVYICNKNVRNVELLPKAERIQAALERVPAWFWEPTQVKLSERSLDSVVHQLHSLHATFQFYHRNHLYFRRLCLTYQWCKAWFPRVTASWSLNRKGY